jgi:hypothetical protein
MVVATPQKKRLPVLGFPCLGTKVVESELGKSALKRALRGGPYKALSPSLTY